nr:proton-coupled zinc antiporter SLC30A2 isoform X1 [Kogia breviceps]
MPGPFAASCPLPLPCGLLHTTRRFTRGSGDRIKPAGAGRHGWHSGGSSGSDSETTPRRPRHGQAGANSRQSGRARGARAGAAGKARRALPAGECAPPRSVPRATSREHTVGRAGPHGGHREEASVGPQVWSRDGAGWIPLSSPGLDLQPIELTTKSNHYCHAQTGPGSHCDPKKKRAWRQLCVACAFCLLFMIGEVIGGYLAHSLAIMTDAAHLLTDFASMLISLFSLWMSSRAATKTMNFGWQRAEILGALLSVLSIWVVTGVLVYLAVERLISGDYEIEEGTMLITSGCAVVVNVIMGLILHQSGHGHGHGHEHSHDTSQQQENPSVRAAFIHVVGDFLQSLGVLVAAFILYFKPEYKFIDPICTFLFSILVLGTTLTILRDVILVLMEGTPRGMDFMAVRDLLLSVEGVEALHSLHIWALTVAQPILSVHVVISGNADAQTVLKAASARLQGKFHFHTMTIQIEDCSEDMKDCQSCQGPSG